MNNKIMGYFNNEIAIDIENQIKTDYRNGEMPEPEPVSVITARWVAEDKKENTKCDHQCSGNCRREGCNCECGEFHYSGSEEGYCATCNAIIGDGHDCDNCSYCAIDNQGVHNFAGQGHNKDL